jgi:hypothetical protein
MTKRFGSLSAVLLLLAVLGKFYAKPLLAQVRAALVQNINEPGLNPYWSQLNILPDAAPGCSNPLGATGGLCEIVFPKVPAGKRLVITNVTGVITAAAPGIPAPGIVLRGLDANGNLSGTPILMPSSTVTPGTRSFSAVNLIGINASVLAYYDAGITPVIDIALTSYFAEFPPNSGSVTISGYLVNL